MRTLKDVGEKEVVKLLQRFLDAQLNYSTNEDAYLYDIQRPFKLINVDTMSRNSDFLPGQTYQQIGAKLVTSTFSDLAAKGARPEFFLSSIISDDGITLNHLKELVGSLKQTSNRYGALYLGGDLGSADEAVLTGIGLGTILKGKILPRNGAKTGDSIYVTDYFGLTALALEFSLSLKDSTSLKILSENISKDAKKALYEPEPKIIEGRVLSEYELASACIDSSDGLAISLHWLAQESQLGMIIETLPIHPKLNFYLESDQERFDYTMYGGEEYELVFTIPPEKEKQLKLIFAEKNLKCYKIGRCIEGTGVQSTVLGKKQEIPMRGWDTFKKSYHHEI